MIAVRLLLLVVLASLAAAAPAAAADALPGAKISDTKLVPSATYPGMQHLHYEYGPIDDHARARTTSTSQLNDLKPQVPGYITRFKPNLVYSRHHKVPRVDVIHLHHGVWLHRRLPDVRRRRGEDDPPASRGLRLPLQPERQLDHELHDPQPDAEARRRCRSPTTSTSCPTARRRRQGITPAHPLWMDVAGIKRLPGLRRATRARASKGSSRSPTRRAAPQQKRHRPRARVDRRRTT